MTLVKLGEVCRTQSGGTPSRKQPSFWASDNDGIPWVKSQELTDGPVCSVSETITPLGLSESSAKLLPSGTVLLAMYGGIPTVGRVGYLTTDAATNQAICALFPEPDRIDNVFLFYALVEARQRLWAKAHGAAQQNVSQTLVRELEIHVPPLEHQYRIGSVLRTLDDLIENNRRRIEALEEMAQAIYREWFVHFRFPGHEDATFVDSPLGPIPEGWEVGRLRDVATEARRSVKQSSETAAMAYVPIDSISPRSLTLRDSRPGEEAASSLRLFEEGEILFGAMRAYFHKVCIAPFPGVTRSTCFVLTPDPSRPAFAAHALSQVETIDFAAAHSTGSTIPYTKWDGVLSEMLIPLPPMDLSREFDEVADPLLGMARSLVPQIGSLRAIRDMLLPKLVSGEIDVADLDLDAVLEGAV